MVKRGYTVFEREVDQRCATALRKRRKPMKRDDEWLAVRYIRIDEDVRPHRPDLPIVYSTRKPRIELEV